MYNVHRNNEYGVRFISIEDRESIIDQYEDLYLDADKFLRQKNRLQDQVLNDQSIEALHKLQNLTEDENNLFFRQDFIVLTMFGLNIDQRNALDLGMATKNILKEQELIKKKKEELIEEQQQSKKSKRKPTSIDDYRSNPNKKFKAKSKYPEYSIVNKKAHSIL